MNHDVLSLGTCSCPRIGQQDLLFFDPLEIAQEVFDESVKAIDYVERATNELGSHLQSTFGAFTSELGETVRDLLDDSVRKLEAGTYFVWCVCIVYNWSEGTHARVEFLFFWLWMMFSLRQTYTL